MAEAVPLPTRARATQPATGTGLPPRDARMWCLAASASCVLPLLLQLPPATAAGLAVVGIVVGAAALRGRMLPALLRAALAIALIGIVFASTRFSIGRDTGCALLAAMLVLKPIELRSLRDARSLVGFALFAPFATFLLDQGPLSLLLGMAGAVTGLAALQRLAEPGPVDGGAVGAGMPAISPWRRFTGVGRLVAIGLPLALVAFWVFPRIDSPLWGVPERAIARPGLSGEMSPGDWLDIVADDRVALRIAFDGPAPPEAQMYWRGPVLWDYDGRTWRQAGWLGAAPPAEVRGGTRHAYDIEIEATERTQLVALDLPVAVPDEVRLSSDRSATVARPLITTRRWRMQSVVAPAAFAPELRAPERRAALHLPADFNPRTLALGRRWRAEAGADDAAIIRRALAWIGDDFGYTLDTPFPGRHAVDEFLFDQQRGYCEHFSSAFVVLMRAAGIPARVVTGYTGGARNRYGDYWLVRNADAHAWTEAWLPVRGWVRVDPTAAVAPERVYDTLADRGGVFDGAGLAPVRDFGDWMLRGWNDFVLGFDARRQRSLLRPLGGGELESGQLGALFAALAGLALAAMAWLVLRGERERDPVLRAWRRLDGRYARLGLGRAAHEPATDWAGRVARARPSAGAALGALSARFEDWRYARAGGAPGEARALLRALRRHRP